MRILVPVDGSSHSRTVLQFLAARRALLGSSPTIDLVNVQHSVPSAVMQFLDLQAVRSAYEAEGRKVFDAIKADIDLSGLEPEEKVILGDAGTAIAEEADRTEADLIVMGTRGLNPVKGFFLGSVSTSVLAHTKTPLLLIRNETPVPETSNVKVGIAVDGAENGIAAVEYVLSNAEFFGPNATFEIVHATPAYHTLLSTSAYMVDTIGPLVTEKEFTDAQTKLFEEAVRPAIELFRAAGLPCEARHLTGEAATTIAEYADANLDMLVMGSHGRGNFSSAVMGSTAMHIAAETKAPILIVRN